MPDRLAEARAYMEQVVGPILAAMPPEERETFHRNQRARIQWVNARSRYQHRVFWREVSAARQRRDPWLQMMRRPPGTLTASTFCQRRPEKGRTRRSRSRAVRARARSPGRDTDEAPHDLAAALAGVGA
jgi:hypothetical protein